MTITNYDFLEAIYKEYQSWIRFEPELLNGKPLLQEFYYNNQSYGKIDEKLRVIAKHYLKELENEADDFEGTMECRLEPLMKYWNYIHPIFDNCFINNGCDGCCDHEHNFMYALYFGTLDCIAVLALAYYKKKLRFDLSGFENLDKFWLGERLHKHGIYGKASFEKNLQHMELFPEQYVGDGQPNVDNVQLDTTSVDKQETDTGVNPKSIQGHRDKRIVEAAMDTKWIKSDNWNKELIGKVARYLVKEAGIMEELPDGNYKFTEPNVDLFAYLVMQIRKHTKDGYKYPYWPYFKTRFSCQQFSKDNINDAIGDRINKDVLPKGHISVDMAIRKFK